MDTIEEIFTALSMQPPRPHKNQTQSKTKPHSLRLVVSNPAPDMPVKTKPEAHFTIVP